MFFHCAEVGCVFFQKKRHLVVNLDSNPNRKLDAREAGMPQIQWILAQTILQPTNILYFLLLLVVPPGGVVYLVTNAINLLASPNSNESWLMEYSWSYQSLVLFTSVCGVVYLVTKTINLMPALLASPTYNESWLMDYSWSYQNFCIIYFCWWRHLVG